jgi:uncharacterized NAD(P)/FAD-binding protein YdhS
MRSPGRTIAIVGGGFSGTVLAANLLRRAAEQPTRIVLIERRAEIGRGVAYQREGYEGYPHLLNVPAERMSAQTDEPLQFAQFAQARDPRCQPHDFLPRQLYGEYLQDLLQRAQQAARPNVTLERIQAQAHAVFRIDPKGPYLVSLSNQQRVLADELVLACGDPPPTSPTSAEQVAGHRAYLCDPFRDGALRAEAKTMLLIGTGLTMADVAIAAANLSPEVQIHAISRHGLLPAAQSLTHPSASHASAVVGDLRSRLRTGAISARSVLAAFRSLLADIECHAGDWRDAINITRQAAPGLWRELSQPERARFLRHLRAYWDVHRHRMPPSVEANLRRLRERGQLHVHAGHLRPLSADGDHIVAQWRTRGSDTVSTLRADRVVNCAGTDRRLSQCTDPLLRGLIADGLAVPDPLGLGWHTGERGALIDRQGVTAEHLFYLGPMLRARCWEATAVGELREHAQALANALSPTIAYQR